MVLRNIINFAVFVAAFNPGHYSANAQLGLTQHWRPGGRNFGPPPPSRKKTMAGLCFQVIWGLRGLKHSRPQSLRSFRPVVGIESSGLVQHRKFAIHGLPFKSSKSDWLTMRNEYSAHAQKIWSGQSSRSQPQARRIVGAGNENGSLGS